MDRFVSTIAYWNIFHCRRRQRPGPGSRVSRRRGNEPSIDKNKINQPATIAVFFVMGICAACGNSPSGSRNGAQDAVQKKDQPSAASTVKVVAPEYRTRATILET